jgi:hypothetical protein
VFNLLSGQGLGFTSSKLLAFGLGAMVVSDVEVPVDMAKSWGGASTAANVRVFDNAYSKRDDDDIIDILTILFQVIE